MTVARPGGQGHRRTNVRGETTPAPSSTKPLDSRLRGWAATSPPPPSSSAAADKGEKALGRTPREGGGTSIALPPLRPASRGAPGSGDPAVPAQPGYSSARLMGSATVLRHRCRVLIFPARRLSARPRCRPVPQPDPATAWPPARGRGSGGQEMVWPGIQGGYPAPPRSRGTAEAALETAPGPGVTRETDSAPPPPLHRHPITRPPPLR